ncbi:type I polyketide synthase [Tessaracoccus sp. OH4464_COT-324]|uniref:type I polyketide synthase n=1 Tax=Tessaracoccus sp. OH4464_COT-324 TaxID=2491059 RepID=UPI000F633D00|nr:beta-ketoacyl synthase N-terminal-like domain-containing protein [Tessaracoccus sp. OH4464_COT-324]RRD47244.1 hypothetical protein EII42_03005 [Tessaracoccus sp. OH4464_COT-324]
MNTKLAKSQTYRRALAVIEKLREELAEARAEAFSPIAVIGMGCRYPGGADDPKRYWDILMRCIDGVGEVPLDRWDAEGYFDPDGGPGRSTSRWGGFLEGIDQFDPGFFQLSMREAVETDPNQRLALEVAWHAFEDAGIVGRLAGSRTGIFVGVVGNDYATTYFTDPKHLSAYAATGTAHSILSGRLAYLFDTRGPALSIDTACSSSLVAIFEACRALQTRDCDVALAGGVNVMLSPLPNVAFSQFNMLSPTGRCRSFDASADGFVRSEGCGMVVLKRLSDAQADGDRVLAVIRGGAMNQDGRSTGLTAPNVDSQRALLHEALRSARIQPEQISFVEAHGTGTSIGDPIEAAALADVYHADEGNEWFLGTVKSNLGHMEAAAGVAGFTKVVLALQHQTIPPNLHYEALNPFIDSERVPFKVPTEPVPWLPRSGSRVAGVSSFGLSGTNVHLLVEEAPDPGSFPESPTSDSFPQILPFSAASPNAVRELARLHRAALEDESVGVADYCWSTAMGRFPLPYRAAVVGNTRAELRQALAEVAKRPNEGISYSGRPAPKVGFVLGETAQQPEQIPVRLSDEIPSPTSGRGWEEQMAAVELWRRLGFEPDVVHGSAGGELLAAVVAGVIDFTTARRLAEAAHRGEPAALQQIARSVETAGPRTRWYSEVLGGRVTPRELANPRIWSKLANADAPGSRQARPIQQADCDLLLALGGPQRFIAPVPVLAAGRTNHRQTMLESLRELFLAGARPNWSELEPEGSRRRVPVALTPYDRVRIWTSAPSALCASAGNPSPLSTAPNHQETGRSLTREELLAVSPGQRFEVLASHLEAELDAALGQETIKRDWDRPLLELGVDSLMALGIRKRLKTDLGVDLSVSALLRESSVASITAAVLQRLDRPAGEATEAGGSGFSDDLLAELEKIPLEEALILLGEDSE